MERGKEVERKEGMEGRKEGEGMGGRREGGKELAALSIPLLFYTPRVATRPRAAQKLLNTAVTLSTHNLRLLLIVQIDPLGGPVSCCSQSLGGGMRLPKVLKFSCCTEECWAEHHKSTHTTHTRNRERGEGRLSLGGFTKAESIRAQEQASRWPWPSALRTWG